VGTRYLNTLQLHAVQTTKTWAAPGNEAMVQASGTVRACSTENLQLYTCSQHLSSHNLYTHEHMVRLHLHVQCARYDADIILVKSC